SKLGLTISVDGAGAGGAAALAAERVYLEGLKAQCLAELRVHAADEEIRHALGARLEAIRQYYQRRAGVVQLHPAVIAGGVGAAVVADRTSRAGYEARVGAIPTVESVAVTEADDEAGGTLPAAPTMTAEEEEEDEDGVILVQTRTDTVGGEDRSWSGSQDSPADMHGFAIARAQSNIDKAVRAAHTSYSTNPNPFDDSDDDEEGKASDGESDAGAADRQAAAFGNAYTEETCSFWEDDEILRTATGGGTTTSSGGPWRPTPCTPTSHPSWASPRGGRRAAGRGEDDRPAPPSRAGRPAGGPGQAGLRGSLRGGRVGPTGAVEGLRRPRPEAGPQERPRRARQEAGGGARQGREEVRRGPPPRHGLLPRVPLRQGRRDAARPDRGGPQQVLQDHQEDQAVERQGQPPPPRRGYRDVKLNLDLDGHVCEVQAVPRARRRRPVVRRRADPPGPRPARGRRDHTGRRGLGPGLARRRPRPGRRGPHPGPLRPVPPLRALRRPPAGPAGPPEDRPAPVRVDGVRPLAPRDGPRHGAPQEGAPRAAQARQGGVGAEADRRGEEVRPRRRGRRGAEPGGAVRVEPVRGDGPRLRHDTGPVEGGEAGGGEAGRAGRGVAGDLAQGAPGVLRQGLTFAASGVCRDIL
ncbi:hypothetical protein THAOC_14139, partial [Thalassiosira oceanica]